MLLISPVYDGLNTAPRVLNIPIIPPEVAISSNVTIRDGVFVSEVGRPATAVENRSASRVEGFGHQGITYRIRVR